VMRLNRYIARCGVASRRDSDSLITAGRVAVNGIVCQKLGTTVAPGIDVVTVDGEMIELPRLLYYKCYKPRGMVTTLDDPQKRSSLADLLKERGIPKGVAPAGRLDADSEGLLVLTNDGDLLQRLTHPGGEVEKVYRVLIDRWPMESDLERLRAGVRCGDFTARALRVTRMGPQPQDNEHPQTGYWVEMAMGEGHKREIREMMGAIKYRVLRLVRTAHGPIRTDTLKPGEIVELEDWEIRSLLGD